MTQYLKQKGFFLIEVVVAVGIITAVLVFMLSLIQNTVEVSQRSLERTQAGYLLEGGADIVRVVRDNGWDTISTFSNNTNYYPLWNGSEWLLSSVASSDSEALDNGFTRVVVFSPVYRDSTTQDIVSSGGVLDAGTRLVTITVTWSKQGKDFSESLSFYIADIRG